MGTKHWIQSALCLLLALAPGLAQDEEKTTTKLGLTTGKEIFEATCAGCHGSDTKGQPQAILGFQPPSTFPDFADCPTATPEPDIQWRAIITYGGRARGFSRIMPSFGEVLTQDEIGKVIDFLRSACTTSGWSLAEFNIPRPLFTEKAFPENETVLTTQLSADGSSWQSTLLTELRFGARTNIEITTPFGANNNSLAAQPGKWTGGASDFALEFKRRVYTNPRTKTLIAAASELNFPTGSVAKGTGQGVFYPEPFVSIEQLLPKRFYFFNQTGGRVPVSNVVPRRLFLRYGAGKSFSTEGGHGRTISPMVELLGTRIYQTGGRMSWDAVPQMQVTISKRQHIRLNVGVRMPINNFDNRAKTVAFYLLWDWFDGGLFQGWK